MQPTRILTQTDVERVIDLPVALRVIEAAFKAQAQGQVIMPPKVYLPLPDGSDFRAMPAFLKTPASSGVKWVSVHPRNPSRGLPTVMGLVLLNDPSTGAPLAVMDGLSITRIRTAAAAGVAAKTLARRTSRVVGLVGCGAQALWQVRVLDHLFRLSALRVWGARDGEAAAFCRRARPQLRVTPSVATTIETCVRAADIVVTLTPSRRPLVQRAWISPGTHLNAIGADAPGKQELDPQILRDAIVIVDDMEQATHGGELNIPISQGLLTPKDVRGTLGEVLLRRVAGRTRPEQITVFDSTGIAVHDVALGHEVYRRAIARKVGRRVAFFRASP